MCVVLSNSLAVPDRIKGKKKEDNSAGNFSLSLSLSIPATLRGYCATYSNADILLPYLRPKANNPPDFGLKSLRPSTEQTFLPLVSFV